MWRNKLPLTVLVRYGRLVEVVEGSRSDRREGGCRMRRGHLRPPDAGL